MDCKIKPGKFYILQYDFNIMTKHGIKKVGEQITYDDLVINDACVKFINSMWGLGAFKEVLIK